MSYLHRKEDGTVLRLKDLELNYLKTIINKIKKKSEHGIDILRDGRDDYGEYFWEKIYLSPKEAEIYYNIKEYKNELKKREDEILTHNKKWD